jgi:hypothetical protein
MKESVESVSVLLMAVRVPIEVIGVPKENVRVQHSHNLFNTPTASRKFYRVLVDWRGLENACRGR